MDEQTAIDNQEFVEVENEVDIEDYPETVRGILYSCYPHCQNKVLELLGQFQEETAQALMERLASSHGETNLDESPDVRGSVGSGDGEQRNEDHRRNRPGASVTGASSGGPESGLPCGGSAVKQPLGTAVAGDELGGVENRVQDEGCSENCPRGTSGTIEDGSGGDTVATSDTIGSLSTSAKGVESPEQEPDECVFRRDEPVEGNPGDVAPNDP